MTKKQDISSAVSNAFNIITIKKALHYGAQISTIIVPLIEKPSLFKGVKAAFDIGKMFAEDVEIWADSYFDRGWTIPYSYEFSKLIVPILSRFKTETLRTSEQDRFIKVVKLGKSKVAWIYNSHLDTVDCIYAEEATSHIASKIISKLLWEKYKNKSIVLHRKVSKDGKVNDIEFDVDDTIVPLPSEIAEKTSAHIKKFLDVGVCRSVMIYGPPGTGKSTLTRAIINNLQLRSFRVRVEDAGDVENTILSEAINTFNPEAIILDDFDRVRSQDSLLETLEFFQKRVKLIVATVNDRSKLDPALLRPGRFDEFIHLVKMDENVIKHMLGEFTDAFEIVKDWPVAYIEEYVKRRRVMSKEETLLSLHDLTERLTDLHEKEEHNQNLLILKDKGKKKK